MNALVINSSLEMTFEEENDPIKLSHSLEKDLEFWDLSPVHSSPVDRVRDSSLLKAKRGVAARLIKSSVRTQNLTTLKRNLKTLKKRLASAEEQLDYIADELVMKKEEKYVKKLIEMRRNGDGMY